MKNYRALIAIALTVMMVFSVYSMVTSAIEQEQQLEKCLQEAKHLAQEALVGKAVEKYTEAIALDNNIEYYHAVSDLYFQYDQLEYSIEWGEETINTFPQDPTGYERLLRVLLKREEYKKAYEILGIADGRGARSPEIERYRAEMKSLYFTQHIAIEDYYQCGDAYSAVCNNGKWGVIASDATTVIPLEYASVSPFVNGMAAVQDTQGTWFFADEQGAYTANISNSIKGAVTYVGVVNEDKFPVCVDGKYSYYDLAFTPVLEGYDFAGTFNAGVAAVKKGNAWHLINGKGEHITKDSYEEIATDTRGICCLRDRIAVKQKGQWFLLDGSGKKVSSEGFEAIRLPAGSELLAVKKNGKWGFADLDGKLVIKPQYEDAKSFSSGMAAVCRDGLWGYIDENNTVCIDFIFLSCSNMTEQGTALVQQEYSWRILKLYSKNY